MASPSKIEWNDKPTATPAQLKLRAERSASE